MAYVTSFERIARAEGRAEGFAEGRLIGCRLAIAIALDAKFGSEGDSLNELAAAMTDYDQLYEFALAAIRAVTLEDVRIFWKSAAMNVSGELR